MGSVNKSIMPCAACKLLRRRCTKDCIFLPHFPPTEPQKFAAAHQIFGASNVSKLLQDIPVNDREDAVTSMVYEANARIRDPVYGCVGIVATLQKQVFQLQSELNAALAEAVALRNQLSDALPLIASSQAYPSTYDMEENIDTFHFPQLSDMEENIDTFHFPQLMSQCNNNYGKDFDGMRQSPQVLDSCQANGSRARNLR